jgi:hypothetical protein
MPPANTPKPTATQIPPTYTPRPPTPTPTRTAAVYQSEQYPFSIEIPDGLYRLDEESLAAMLGGGSVSAFYIDENVSITLTIDEKDMESLGLPDGSLETYFMVYTTLVLSRDEDITEIVSTDMLENPNGLQVVILELRGGENGNMWINELVYIYQGEVALHVGYVAFDERVYQRYKPKIQASFNSLTLTD